MQGFPNRSMLIIHDIGDGLGGLWAIALSQIPKYFYSYLPFMRRQMASYLYKIPFRNECVYIFQNIKSIKEKY